MRDLAAALAALARAEAGRWEARSAAWPPAAARLRWHTDTIRASAGTIRKVLTEWWRS